MTNSDIPSRSHAIEYLVRIIAIENKKKRGNAMYTTADNTILKHNFGFGKCCTK